MTTLRENASRVKTREELASFIGELREDFKRNGKNWENNTLESFFEAMKGYVIDMDGLYKNEGNGFPDNIKWNIFAEILLASSMYE